MFLASGAKARAEIGITSPLSVFTGIASQTAELPLDPRYYNRSEVS
jgi:hypothetical protein